MPSKVWTILCKAHSELTQNTNQPFQCQSHMYTVHKLGNHHSSRCPNTQQLSMMNTRQCSIQRLTLFFLKFLWLLSFGWRENSLPYITRYHSTPRVNALSSCFPEAPQCPDYIINCDACMSIKLTLISKFDRTQIHVPWLDQPCKLGWSGVFFSPHYTYRCSDVIFVNLISTGVLVSLSQPCSYWCPGVSDTRASVAARLTINEFHNSGAIPEKQNNRKWGLSNTHTIIRTMIHIHGEI